MTDRREKKAQFEKGKKEKHLSLAQKAVLVLVVLSAGALVAFVTIQKQDGGHPLVAGVNGTVSIPFAEVNDGQAHYFNYAHEGSRVKFFLLKSTDGIVRAAFDTCDVCYREGKGYHQEGDFMVCNNCGQKFRSDLINEIKGGCNPAPLARTVSSDRILIAESDLAGGARYFQGRN
jgi:uncharacterized membrane protein